MKPIRLRQLCLTIILGFIIHHQLAGQANSFNYDLYSLSENNKLEVFNRKVSTFSEKDKKGIRLSKNENDGIVWLKHIIFSNGIIELDIRGKDDYQQSFVGIAFHGVDNVTLDAVYFRPFNFQSTDSIRRIHAVQYISQPDFPWQVLREKFNGRYEKALNPAPGGNDWFHAKIVIKYPNVTVYVNDNHEPSLSVEMLNNRTSGKIGLWVGNNSDGDFANLLIRPEDKVN
ncbi:MAG: hypothetical protein WA816_03575 [Bacteroidales bacterium]